MRITFFLINTSILLLFSEFAEKLLNPQRGIRLIPENSFPRNKFIYLTHLYGFEDLTYTLMNERVNLKYKKKFYRNYFFHVLSLMYISSSIW